MGNVVFFFCNDLAQCILPNIFNIAYFSDKKKIEEKNLLTFRFFCYQFTGLNNRSLVYDVMEKLIIKIEKVI